MNQVITVLLALTAAIFLGLAATVLYRERTPAARFFSAMVTLAAIWALTYIAELNSSTLNAKISFLQVRLMFICFIPLAWLGLVLSLTGKFHVFKKSFFLLLLIVPVITAGLALTTRLHNQFRYDFAIESFQGLSLLVYKRSHWDILHEINNHLVSLLGFFILLSAWHSSNRHMRKQTILLSISFIIPLTANLLYIFDIIPRIGISPTPFLLLPAALIQAWVVLNTRILDIIPIARSMVLEQIDIGMIVIDTNQRIADINPAALTLIGTSESRSIGHSIQSLPPPWSQTDLSDSKKNTPIRIETDGEARWIRIEKSPISSPANSMHGRLLLLKDVTKEVIQRQKAELEREHEEQQKQLHLQQLLLRDIHDGLGGLTSNLLYMSVLAQKETDPVKKDEWLRKIETTSTETNTEIRSLMNTLEATSITWGELITTVRRTTRILFNKNQTRVEFHILNVPNTEELGFTEGLSITRMIRECMNNIVKHAHATRVDIRINASSEAIQIDIEDNGCGFDIHSVARGRGLNNLEKRATELGGHFSVTSTGTTLQTIVIPLPVHIVNPIET